MTVSIKDAAKFIGITIVACCAALVCNMFLNYDIDLRAISGLVEDGAAQTLYDALKLNNTVVCAVTGGCLVLTSVVLLVFYIGHYIEANAPRFGVLKALGYSDIEIAAKCAVFGFCVLLGTVAGVALSWTIMPRFYAAQNDNGGLLPEIALKFHAWLSLLMIVLPTLVFSALSVAIAYLKIKLPALSLIKGNARREIKVKEKRRESGRSFLAELSLNVLNERKSLAFFIAFGGFCFSAMTQMGVSMRDYASDMMGIMILVIGLILAAMSLFLAMSSVVSGNAKKLTMLKVNGYSLKESGLAVLGMYCIPAYIGFGVGSAYQYGLLNVMINVVFKSFDDVPVYTFDWVAFAICFVVFTLAYVLLNFAYVVHIGRLPIKSVMSE